METPIRYHWTILLGAAAVVVASILLTADTEAVYLLGHALPESCLVRRIWGIECLGCGLTRSFVHMGHLDLAGAFGLHKLGPLFWSLTAVQVPYRAWVLGRRYLAGKGPK